MVRSAPHPASPFASQSMHRLELGFCHPWPSMASKSGVMLVGATHPVTPYVRDTATKYHIFASLPFRLRPSALLSIKKGAPPDRVPLRGYHTPITDTVHGDTPYVGCVQPLCNPWFPAIRSWCGSLQEKRSQACTLNSIRHVGTALCHYIGILLLLGLVLIG